MTLPRLSWHDDSMICCRLPPPLQVLPLLRLVVHYFVLVEVVEESLLYVVLQLSYVQLNANASLDGSRGFLLMQKNLCCVSIKYW